MDVDFFISSNISKIEYFLIFHTNFQCSKESKGMKQQNPNTLK